MEWLRCLSDQWWIGRSYERISGALHFVSPIDEHGRTIGAPTPVARISTPSARMRSITAEIWTQAADNAAAGQPSGERGLAADAKHMFASEEFRAACVLACGAFEAARDRTLEENSLKVSDLRCSDTNLLQHLSKGFAHVFRRNLKEEEPALYDLTKAFWTARGHAAHGKPIQWRLGNRVTEIDRADLAALTIGIDDIVGWINGVRLDLAPAGEERS